MKTKILLLATLLGSLAFAQIAPRPGLVYKWGGDSQLQPALFQKITTLRAIPVLGDVDLEAVCAIDNDGAEVWGGFGLTRWTDIGADLDLSLTLGLVFASKRPTALFAGIGLRF